MFYFLVNEHRASINSNFPILIMHYLAQGGWEIELKYTHLLILKGFAQNGKLNIRE